MKLVSFARRYVAHHTVSPIYSSSGWQDESTTDQLVSSD